MVDQEEVGDDEVHLVVDLADLVEGPLVEEEQVVDDSFLSLVYQEQCKVIY